MKQEEEKLSGMSQDAVAEMYAKARGSFPSSTSTSSASTPKAAPSNYFQNKYGLSKEDARQRMKLVNRVLQYNKSALVAEAVDTYDELKSRFGRTLELLDYSRIISSFAPRRIMWRLFVPSKDYCDMYIQTAKCRPDERVREAREVFEDIERVGNRNYGKQLVPDAIAYNSLMKVQLTGGDSNLGLVFRTFGDMVRAQVEPNLASYIALIRACALNGDVDEGRKLYDEALLRYTGRTDQAAITIHFHNTMLDVYAQRGHEEMHNFFTRMLTMKHPAPDGISFNTYAKGIIIRQENERLLELAERMRVLGVLQRELSPTIRREISLAYRKYADIYKAKAFPGKFKDFINKPDLYEDWHDYAYQTSREQFQFLDPDKENPFQFNDPSSKMQQLEPGERSTKEEKLEDEMEGMDEGGMDARVPEDEKPEAE